MSWLAWVVALLSAWLMIAVVVGVWIGLAIYHVQREDL
jgi:uncharacterized membrane protein